MRRQVVWNLPLNILGRFINSNGDLDQADEANVSNLDVGETHGGSLHCLCAHVLKIPVVRWLKGKVLQKA